MSSRSDELDWDSNESLDFLSSSIDNKLEIIVIILGIIWCFALNQIYRSCENRSVV